MVKEIYSYGGDVSALVPSVVVERLNNGWRKFLNW
jgi:phosphopantetheine adenylyltransferase